MSQIGWLNLFDQLISSLSCTIFYSTLITDYKKYSLPALSPLPGEI